MIYVKGIFPEDGNPLSPDIDNFIQTIRYVTCIGVKIPSRSLQVRDDLPYKRAITQMRPNRDCYSGTAKTDTGDNDTSA